MLNNALVVYVFRYKRKNYMKNTLKKINILISCGNSLSIRMLEMRIDVKFPMRILKLLLNFQKISNLPEENIYL